MIFETHAHYDDEKFSEDQESVIMDLKNHGVERVVNVGASIDSSRASLALAEKYDFMYAAIGVHPSDISCLTETTLTWLKEKTALPKVVAIGEIGLDYYWDKEEEVQNAQRDWFWKQLEIAAEKQLPVIIHSRDAAEDTLRILKEFQTTYPEIKQPGVIHCYSYSPEMAKEFVRMGYYIGIGGVVTFKNAKKLVKTVEEISIENIVIETDCPYMAPEPNRGKRNDSRNLVYVIEKIAEIKGLTPQEVEKITEKNAKALYRLS